MFGLISKHVGVQILGYFLTQILGLAFWVIFGGYFFQCLGSFSVTHPLGQM